LDGSGFPGLKLPAVFQIFKGRGSTKEFTVFRSEVDFEMSETHLVVNIYKVFSFVTDSTFFIYSFLIIAADIEKIM